MITELKYNDKEEWLELRKKYIGGSDAAIVVGLNPYSSRYALWCEKTGRTPGFEGNISTRVGAYLEDFVATLFTEQTGIKVETVVASGGELLTRIAAEAENPQNCVDFAH